MICQAKPTNLVSFSVTKKNKKKNKKGNPKTTSLKKEYDTVSVVEENVEKFTLKTNKAVVWTQNYPE